MLCACLLYLRRRVSADNSNKYRWWSVKRIKWSQQSLVCFCRPNPAIKHTDGVYIFYVLPGTLNGQPIWSCCYHQVKHWHRLTFICMDNHSNTSEEKWRSRTVIIIIVISITIHAKCSSLGWQIAGAVTADRSVLSLSPPHTHTFDNIIIVDLHREISTQELIMKNLPGEWCLLHVIELADRSRNDKLLQSFFGHLQQAIANVSYSFHFCCYEL